MSQKQASIAKIARPHLSQVFPRERLFRLLEHGRRRPVIWVSGPAGSGKTTLVSSYIDSGGLPCLWYRVDGGDADIATFFYYMGLAGKKAAPRRRVPLPLLTPEYLSGIPTFTIRYFEALYSRLKPPFIVVLDNYQHVPHNSPFHEVIRNGLSNIPPGITVIVVSRADPPPPLVGLRAQNALEVIGWQDLRLTIDELRGILGLREYGEMPMEAIQQIHEITQGWAAGLVLIMERLKREGGESRSLGTLAHEDIFDYFAGEIFDTIDRDTQNFLLRTSFLPTMTSHMAERLSGQPGAGRILATMNRHHFFTEKHALLKPLYQYHPLFREFLLSRAREAFPGEDIPNMQRSAAALLEESGQIEDAAALFQEAGDVSGLVRLVLGHAQALVTQGRYRTLEQWLTSLPETLLHDNPWLLYWHGVCRQPFHPSEARDYFEKALQSFNARRDSAGEFLSWSSMVDSFLYEWNNFTPLDRWIQWLEDSIRSGKSFPSPEIEAKVTSSISAALMIRQPHHPDIDQWIERGLSLSRQCRDANIYFQAYSFTANYYFWAGNQNNIKVVMEEIRRLAHLPRASPLVELTWKWLEAAMYIWAMASPASALQKVSDALEYAGKTGVHVWDHMLFALGVYGSLTQGDLARAEDFLRQMEFTLHDSRRHGYCHYHYLYGWYYLLKGEYALAHTHGETALTFAQETGYVFPIILCRIEMGQVLHAQGRSQDAGAHLARAYNLSLQAKSPIFQYMCLLAQAQVALDHGREQTGLQLLRRAMLVGREQEYVSLLWWWHPSAMARLCARALEAGIEVEYVQGLIQKSNLVPDTTPIEIENWPWAIRVYTLGQFRLLRGEKPLRFSRKAPKKPIEMLKALIAFGGRDVREDRVYDVLWPDADGDAAYKAFGMTLSRLRELLDVKDAIQLRGGSVTLDPRYFWIDTWAFEHILEMADSAQEKGQATEVCRLLEKALDLYKGPFLGGETEYWSISPRERFKDKFLRYSETVGLYWEERKEWKKAIGCYKKGLEADDLVEDFYRRVMICCQRLGHTAEALSTCLRCKKTFQSYGIEPSPDIDATYESLLSGNGKS